MKTCKRFPEDYFTLTVYFMNTYRKTLYHMVESYNFGSIISVVGKSTVEIMEPFLV